jgi:hypothetical protein
MADWPSIWVDQFSTKFARDLCAVQAKRLLGVGVAQAALRDQNAPPLTQRSNNKQQIAASKQTTNKQLGAALFARSRWRVVVG